MKLENPTDNRLYAIKRHIELTVVQDNSKFRIKVLQPIVPYHHFSCLNTHYSNLKITL